jgi:L-threonylcarbamoyladenylate synthase
MQVIKTTSQNLNSAIFKAVRILKNGGVIAHPTDTVWGLAADAGNPKAVAKIHRLKQSDPSKPLLLNLPSKNYLNRIGRKLCKAHLLAKFFWPGALSLLILAKNSDTKIGVRLPDHEISNLLARRFGRPLVTTSANLTDSKVAENAKAVARIFPAIDLILDDGSISKNSASTLVDVSGKEAQLIREGAISFKKILQKLGRHS